METAIEFRHVKKCYGDQVVLPDFNLKIEKGEFVTMIGSSGSGKTTALKMVNGLNLPTEGDVLVNGKSIKDMDLIMLRRNIGYAIQGSVLFPNMTVEENISYVPSLLNKKDRQRTRNAVNKWMKITGLDENLKDRYPAELSGGQQQRVGIARALAASPDILLMDEPFGAVDAITREQLQKEIKRIHQETGITILFVTHDIEEALNLGTRVLVLDHGVIQQYAEPDELLRSPSTEFVERLVHKQRRACYLPEERLEGCEFSGAARACANDRKAEDSSSVPL
ncbi:MAG: ABC transporter ATP-binding protein [Eubacterium sp.]|jgi:osmoprotectant transport system ATP-binding protein|nr:ABC transporter ATP-binding protein [Eubacterium sp.]MCI2196496.1 ABC transporter ATP-binding protein [Eubacterium sp.]